MMKSGILAISVVLAACISGGKSPGSPNGHITGHLDATIINEASGLSASAANPGKLWVHNDSGDGPRIFLVDTTGLLIATVWLENATNRDWEDIAVGPGPLRGRSYLYVADIGDNLGRFQTKRIYRVEEPRISGDTVLPAGNLDSLIFDMPDGPRDSEALFVDPLSGTIYILSKREAHVRLYHLAQWSAGVVTAKKDTILSLTAVTGADISADGTRLLVKTYDSVFYWHRSPNESIVSALLGKRTPLEYFREPQGEAITFELRGSGYYTVSESAGHGNPNLYFYSWPERSK